MVATVVLSVPERLIVSSRATRSSCWKRGTNPRSIGAAMTGTVSGELRAQFGDIDIYLFDQLLRGRFGGRSRVLDAGCGGGRNLPFLLARGFAVFAIDEDPAAVSAVTRLAAQLAPGLPPDNIRQGTLDALPWPDGGMEAVVCSAVLHFARDQAHF